MALLPTPARESVASNAVGALDGSKDSLRESLTPNRWALTPSQMSPQSTRSAQDPRMTQSWHCGANRLEVIPPLRMSRSFDGAALEDWNIHRTFGGIERQPRPTVPTLEQRQTFTTFCRQFESHFQRKPHIIAFVNSKSGGQTGHLLMEELNKSMGKQADGKENCTGQVCDLSIQEEPQLTLNALADTLDPRSPQTVKLLVCGGDGTVTWILTALEQCQKLKGKLHLLPVAIVPLGTGNDLARSLGWSGKMRAVGDIVEYLRLVIQAAPVALDQWRVLLRPHDVLPEDHKLRTAGSHPQQIQDPHVKAQSLDDLQEALGVDEDPPVSGRGSSPPAEDVYMGVWQNYFSIGLDAKVAYYVDQARSNTSSGRCCFRRGCGKVCYAWQGIRRSCCSYLLSRSMGSVRTLSAREAKEEMEDMDPPLESIRADCARGRLRQLMLVNINSYGAGLDVMPRAPLPNHCKEPKPMDGVLEVMGVRNAFFSIGLFARFKRPAYLASTKALAFRLSEGEFMQLDGEPWRLDCGSDVLVERHRTVTMLRAPPQERGGRFWRGHITPDFWESPSANIGGQPRTEVRPRDTARLAV